MNAQSRTSPHTRTSPEIADRYRALAARFTKLIEAVPEDRWSRQTPCEEWTAIDVVEHVATTEAEHLDRMPFGAADPTAPAIAGTEPRAAWATVRDRMQRALDDPATADTVYEGYFGETTLAKSVDQFYSGDLLVHAWDIARGTGLKDFEPMPADEIDAVFASLAPLGDSMRQPGVFGPAVDVPEDADPQTKLLGFVGREA